MEKNKVFKIMKEKGYGRIEISYSGREDLIRLVELLGL